MERSEIIKNIYNKFDEDARLSRSRQGQLEFFTTLHYIHQFVPQGSKLIEIGAGTGRYSIHLANEGYQVTAVELVEKNLEILRNNASGLHNLLSYQGDALDLSRFPDEGFDAVLLFGPMYHLYEEMDLHQAINEAIRITKPGGVIFSAFLSCYAILYNDYLCANFKRGYEFNFDQNGKPKHFKEQVFTGFDIEEFEDLFKEKPVQRMTTAGTDGMLEIAERDPEFSLPDDDFKLFIDFHLRNCEKRELLGSQSHLLHICRKHHINKHLEDKS